MKLIEIIIISSIILILGSVFITPFQLKYQEYKLSELNTSILEVSEYNDNLKLLLNLDDKGTLSKFKVYSLKKQINNFNIQLNILEEEKNDRYTKVIKLQTQMIAGKRNRNENYNNDYFCDYNTFSIDYC
jgi:hypothetical protein